MAITRLKEQPLPADFLDRLQKFTTNATTGSLYTGERKSVTSPFFDGELGWVGVGTAADVDEAFKLARHAQPLWAAKPVKYRAALLERFHDLEPKENPRAELIAKARE